MDVFNSALRNPLPPIRKESDQHGDDSPPSRLNLVQPDDAEDRKKKNLRRKHRNSHLGCGTCKKRRIKCDENLPQCFNCVKGKLHCAYLNLDAPARNALRMAQYNQNLRQDRHDEPKKEKDPEPQPQHYSGMVPMLVLSAPHSNQMPHAPPVAQPTAAPIMQQQYGPLVLFQPMATAVAGITTYLPMQVQVVTSQMPVIFQPDVQMQMMHMQQVQQQQQMQQVQMQQVQLQQQNLNMQKSIEQPVMVMQNTIHGSYEHDLPTVPLVNSAINNVSSALNSVNNTNGAYRVGSNGVSSSTHSNSSDLAIPAIGTLSNPASLRTSPRLPLVRPVLLSLLSAFEHEPRVKPDDASIRLPPIHSTETLQPATSPTSDKVPSIQRLLS